MRRGSIAIATVALVLAAVPASASGAAATVVLGSPNYVSGGEGWGEQRPARIVSGRVPAAVAVRIHWRQWGSFRASGRGFSTVTTPQNGYYRKRVRIQLLAKNVGQCPGESQLAYKALLIRVPKWPGAPLGPWRKWRGTQGLCDASHLDPRYIRRPPGYCGQIEEGTWPGDVDSITAYRVACKRARAVARSARRQVEWRTRSSCARHGCTRRARGFRCRFERLHADEHTGANGYEFPVQRVACRRGRRNITWWFVLDNL
jgi:hypothetical protein